MVSGDQLPQMASKIVCSLMEDVESKERKPLWGDRPNGCIIVTKERQTRDAHVTPSRGPSVTLSRARDVMPSPCRHELRSAPRPWD